MITLPLRSERPPLIRVLVANNFTHKSGVGGTGPWVLLPMLDAKHAGWELLDGLTRPTLPEIGECKLRMRYGVINGKVIGLSSTAFENVQATSSWDSSGDLIEVPSLIGREIRVQAAPDDGTDTPAWATIWWGSCEYESDSEWPAATMPVGERICHCMDGLFRTKRWFMSRHAAYIGTTNYEDCPGHPGYNVGMDGLTLGNKNSANVIWSPYPDSDGKLYAHAWQGSDTAVVWNDLQSAEHALRVNRPEGQPQFSFSGSTTLLSLGASPWPVQESDSAFTIISRICARERGRGLVKVGWADDSGNPAGPLNVRLEIYPQVASAQTYISNPTTGNTSSIPGAIADGTTVEVDLIGDHRLQATDFNRSVRGLAKYDAVETVGENIQVLITASRYDGSNVSLENRWSSDDQTTFLALTFETRLDEKWRQVYQAYGIPREWQGVAGDHDLGAEYALHRIDYRCDDNGAIFYGLVHYDTSPLLVRVLPDTPLLEGYIYSQAIPIRRDGGSETGAPARRPPTVYIRNAANRYDLDLSVNVHIKHNEIHITHGDDEKAGSRYIGDTSLSLGSTYNVSQLGITVGLELPHRLRFKSVSDDLPSKLGVRNVKRIEVPEAHLWLASGGAIWGLDDTTGNANGYTAKRGACGATTFVPGILRDDRARVALLHALACAWYLQEHRPASWTMRCCGLLPTFGVSSAADTADGTTIDPSTTVAYPQLGQLVTTLSANGQAITINSPITGIIYNHQSQTTTWSCDWVDLDVRNG